MWTLAAFSESIDPAGSLANITAVTDDHLTTSGDYIYVGALNNLIGFYVVADGTAAVNAQLQSPSLRDVVLLDISGVMVGTDAVDNGIVHLFPESPIALETGEGLEALINSNPSAAAQQSVVVFLSDGAVTPVTGEIHTIRGTATITGSAGSWVSGAITWGQTLPVGRYQVVGARVETSSAVAARFIPIGAANRPGLPTVADDDDHLNPVFRRGGLGVWFEFDSNTPPMLELLTGSSSSAQTVYLDIIKVA